MPISPSSDPAATADLFDPAHYANVRLPVLEAETLPAWCYTSDAFYKREVQHIFKRTWNFIAREDELKNPGDYATFRLLGEPLLVVRGREGRLRAFANICRHRGTRMLEESGNCRVITCPYHGWAYALDGALIAAPGMDETRAFDRGRYGLLPIRLESWEGFLFATFDSAAEPLAAYLGELPERLASYNFADMVCVRRRSYVLACNWKVYLENAMEDYHTPMVHKTSIGKQLTVRVQGRGAWAGTHLPGERTIALLPEDAESALPPIPSLAGLAAHGSHFLALYPATFFAATQDCMWWLQQFPLGPERTKVVHGCCFPRASVERADFAAKVESYYRRWDASLAEDNAISERQQAGLASSFNRPGRLSCREPLVHDIANWVLDRVLDE